MRHTEGGKEGLKRVKADCAGVASASSTRGTFFGKVDAGEACTATDGFGGDESGKDGTSNAAAGADGAVGHCAGLAGTGGVGTVADGAFRLTASGAVSDAMNSENSAALVVKFLSILSHKSKSAQIDPSVVNCGEGHIPHREHRTKRRRKL